MRFKRGLVVAGMALFAGAAQADGLDLARQQFKGPSSGWIQAFASMGAAAAAGDARGAFYLALMYRNGMGTDADSARAAYWFEAAARGGVPAAMFMLANLLADGEGVAKDETAARHWLEKAAEREYPEAALMIALALREGNLGYERDEARAEQAMKEAAHALKHRPPEP